VVGVTNPCVEADLRKSEMFFSKALSGRLVFYIIFAIKKPSGLSKHLRVS